MSFNSAIMQSPQSQSGCTNWCHFDQKMKSEIYVQFYIFLNAYDPWDHALKYF